MTGPSYLPPCYSFPLDKTINSINYKKHDYEKDIIGWFDLRATLVGM